MIDAPHQWPPDEPEIGVQAAWCPEVALEECKAAAALALSHEMGAMLDGDIDWRWFEPDLAGVVLDSLVENEIDEVVFNYYRKLRANLREHGGLLVIAWARARVPS